MAHNICGETGYEAIRGDELGRGEGRGKKSGLIEEIFKNSISGI